MTTILIILAVLLYLLIGVIVACVTYTDCPSLMILLWLPLVVVRAVCEAVLFVVEKIGE